MSFELTFNVFYNSQTNIHHMTVREKRANINVGNKYSVGGINLIAYQYS